MDRLISSAVTVGKVIFVELVGMWASRHFTAKEESLKTLSHICVKIFLPCLLFSQLAMDLSWEMIYKYYWAGILPLIPMTLGFFSAFAFRSFIPAEFYGMLQLACTFQSIVSYGLGITLNLKISWWTRENKSKAESYVFLFNVLHSIFLWSVGTMIVEKCAKALEEENAVTAAAAAASISERNDAAKEAEGALEECWGYEDYQPTSHPDSAPVSLWPKTMSTTDLTWMKYIRVQLPYLLTEQLVASFLGLLIALVPPFYLLLKNPVGEMIMGGIALLAPGAVPLQLLLLGVNVTAEDDGSTKLPVRFMVGVIALRLFFIPFICFGIIHLLLVCGLMPYDKPFVLVMLILTSAPTAVNTSSICSMYSYKVKEFTKLLLFMYTSCIFTTTVWLTVYVWYLES
ncbi:putative transporter [Trypanosoma rangeli]|uniref:Putative transporter n=1 Tax=Trypanosoma rangeli TaxID=5698 RepID=A0A422NN55_TRYRA|nr:putative transporter [Trypanosoma rangeli]RNF06809.1 putative transporter [Trypanosoma rangeli]|eukprot:RNF06809.1 putative transporter [Trypanosoma rangeli]